jgi:multidrug transporter EmrE-like cation transporter
VVGYFKLALVVLGGFLLFQYPVMPLNILGIILTLSGVHPPSSCTTLPL